MNKINSQISCYINKARKKNFKKVLSFTLVVKYVKILLN